MWKLKKISPLNFIFILFFTSCTSTGTIGLIASVESEVNRGVHEPHTFHTVGPEVNGTACRHFILGIFPWGDSDIESAMRDALMKNPSMHADGLINVSTSTSLYNFLPIYNVYTLTCTTIQGVPIKYDDAKKTSDSPQRNLSPARDQQYLGPTYKF